MKKTILGIILLQCYLLVTFAQQDSSLLFSNELNGKDAYIRFTQNSVKGNDNKLNILFKNNLINYNAIHVAIDVLQKDSFYYVLGSYPNKSFVTKFDLSGNVMWQRMDTVFPNSYTMYDNTENKIIELSNGFFLNIYAHFIPDTTKELNPMFPTFTCFDNNGDNKYSYVWPDTTDFYPTGGLVADKYKGFTFCGLLGSRTLQYIPPNNGNPGYYIPDTIYLGIANIDSNLNIKRVAKSFVQYPNCNNESLFVEDLEKAHDGGYIVGGHIGVCGGVNGWAASTAFAIKFDSLLNQSWSLYFEDSVGKSDTPFNIVPSRDGSYIYTRGHTKTQSIAYGKFDENGNILWEKYFRKTLDTNGLGGVLTIWDRPHGVIEKENGDIIFGSRINWNRATGLVRTDSVGNVKWSRVISTNYGDSLLYYSYVFNVKNPIGEGALLVGRVHTMGAFLIRTDSLGCTLPNCLDTTLHVGLEEIVEMQKQKLIVYPNPAQNTIQIAINNQGEKVKQIIIYDINGRKICNRKSNDYLIDINVSSYTKGVYIVKAIGSEGSILSRKFVKQ